jgi:predicted anti-sigma-YlaC factor YlaD
MNCRRFQHRLYEYLDGTLSSGAQAAAERHLGSCAACQRLLERERQIAGAMTARFRQTTDSSRLPPEVERNVLIALAEERRAREDWRGSIVSWCRLAWLQALAASTLLLLAGLFYFARTSVPNAGSPHHRQAAGDVLVQLSYVVPTYTFRHEDGFVVDALTYQTNVVSQRLPARMGRLE